MNTANTAPQAASLEGERRNENDWTPVIDVKQAPTKIHGELGALIPNVKNALQKDSIKYGNWVPATSEVDTDDPVGAALPVVVANYRSTGYTVTTDPGSESGTIKQEYIQKCRLFLIKAPEATATQPLIDQIVSNLLAKGFSEIDALEWADGVKKLQSMSRYSRIDVQADVDDVYVAYFKVVGDIVIFALESEAAPKSAGPGETQLSRVTEAGMGSRVGGQLTFLVAEHLINP